MSDSKHTPGPWEWNGNSLLSGKYGYYLMNTEECPGLGHSAEANKRLIAAAPDLLEVLHLLQGMNWRLDEDAHGAEIRRRALAAIAKAGG